jgi:hypothetical protein
MVPGRHAKAVTLDGSRFWGIVYIERWKMLGVRATSEHHEENAKIPKDSHAPDYTASQAGFSLLVSHKR